MGQLSEPLGRIATPGFIVQQFAWAQQQQQGILGRGWARKETIVFEYAPTWGRGAAN